MTTCTSPSRSLSTSRFSHRLDAEWRHLRTARRTLDRTRSWGEDHPDHPLSTLVAMSTDLDDIVHATQRGAMPAGVGDAILLRLVELARTDELAGRVVVQRLLPGLISRSLRYRGFHDTIDPVELAVPAAWLAIRSYDTDRRRHHVAASLLSDAVFQAFRRPIRRRSSTEMPQPDRVFVALASDDGPTSAFEELAAVVRDARCAGLPPHDIELLRHLARSDSPGTVAKERNVTPRTVRNHRDRAVARIRAAGLVAA
jgi:DNA-binding CsgD family transcriptional regulator